MNIFISGANRGIGKECVLMLLKRTDVKKIITGTRSLDNIYND